MNKVVKRSSEEARYFKIPPVNFSIAIIYLLNKLVLLTISCTLCFTHHSVVCPCSAIIGALKCLLSMPYPILSILLTQSNILSFNEHIKL